MAMFGMNETQQGLFGIGLSGLGFLSSVFGGASAKKQQDALIRQMMLMQQNNLSHQMSLASPYLQAGQQGLRLTKNFVNQMNEERFKENQYITQARNIGLQDINRQVAQSRNSTNYAFGNNQGRARGEANRIARQGIQSRNQINYDWARQTEADRMNKTQMYLNGMSMLNQAGYTGTNIMSNAYNNYTQNATNILGMQQPDRSWSDFGGALMGVGMNMIGNSLMGNNIQGGTPQVDNYQPVTKLNFPPLPQVKTPEYNSPYNTQLNWGNSFGITRPKF